MAPSLGSRRPSRAGAATGAGWWQASPSAVNSPGRVTGVPGGSRVGLRPPSQPRLGSSGVALVDHVSGGVGEERVWPTRGSSGGHSRPSGCQEGSGWLGRGEPAGPGLPSQGTQPKEPGESGEGPRTDNCVGWGGEIGSRVGVGMGLEVGVGRKNLKQCLTSPFHTHTHPPTHLCTQPHRLEASSRSQSLTLGPFTVPRPVLTPLGPPSQTGHPPFLILSKLSSLLTSRMAQSPGGVHFFLQLPAWDI